MFAQCEFLFESKTYETAHRVATGPSQVAAPVVQVLHQRADGRYPKQHFEETNKSDGFPIATTDEYDAKCAQTRIHHPREKDDDG